jgi:hypothetical protein
VRAANSAYQITRGQFPKHNLICNRTISFDLYRQTRPISCTARLHKMRPAHRPANNEIFCNTRCKRMGQIYSPSLENELADALSVLVKCRNDSARFRISHVECNSWKAVTTLVSVQVLSYYLKYTLTFYSLIVAISTITFKTNFCTLSTQFF